MNTYRRSCPGCSDSISAAARYCPRCGFAIDGEDFEEKAAENVEQWGLQSVDTLLLAMMEELGELSQAHLESTFEEGDPERIPEELSDLMALGYQLRWRIDSDGGEQ